MGLEDAREDNLDMASSHEEETVAAAVVVAPGEEEVKKMESGGGLLMNGAARMNSFNSGFATNVSFVAGDFDMAQSQVAVAGSVDSAAEAPVSASADVDTGPASSSSDVVDSTEKVESWDLSEAVEESAGNKPNFAEDGTLEYMKTLASSNLIADAPTSAASVQDYDGGEAVSVPSADVEEKAVDLSSDDAAVVSEEFPAEISASESVSPNFQDEGSAEKGGSETPDTPLEEVHEATEARNSAEVDDEGAGVGAVLSPTADVEEKSDDVEDKLVDVEDKPADVQDKSVDVVDRSFEMNSEDAGAESEELPAEVAASEEVSPETPDEESAETGDSEAPEASPEDVVEVAEAATSAEPGEDVVTLEASPSPFVDVERKSFELDSDVARAFSVDISPKFEDEGSAAEIGESEASAPVEEVNEVAESLTIAKPLEAAPSPFVDVKEESFELDLGNGRVVSEDVSPQTEGEESGEIGDSAVPEEEVHELTESTTNAELDEGEATLETAPSPVVDGGEESVELDSEDAVASGEDVSPEFVVVGSADEGDSDAPEAPVEEANEIADAAAHVEPEETVASHEGVPSSSNEFGEQVVEVDDKSVDLADEAVGIEDKSVEVSSGDVGAVSEELPAEVGISEEVSPTIPDEESAETGGSEAPVAPVEDVREVTEGATSEEYDEDVATLEASPSPFVDVEEKPFELGSAVAGALSVDASPVIEAEVSTETGESEASAPAEEVNEVAEPINIAEPLEAAPSPFVDVEEDSFELDPEVAPAVSEDVSPETEVEGSAETGDSEAPEALVEEVHEVAEAAPSAEPDEDEATLEASPSPFVDVDERPFELGSDVARALSVDASPETEDEGSAAEIGESEASAPVEEVNEVAEPLNIAEPLEAAPSPFVDVEEESFELDLGNGRVVSEDASPETQGEESLETGDSEAPEAPPEEDHEVAEAATAELDEDEATLEAAPSPFVDVEEKSFEIEPEDSITNPEAYEASVTLDSVPAPAADVDDNFVQEVDSNDTSEAREVPPSKSDEEEDRSPEPPVEGAADVVGSETRYFPDEDVHEVVEETISAEPDEGPESALASSDVAEERSVDLSSEDAIGATTSSESVDKEDVSPEPSIEATTSAGANVSLESGDVEGSESLESGVDEGSAILESMPSPATDVQDGPADGSADKLVSESLFTPVEEVHEVVESTITADSDDGSTILESGLTPNDGEEKPEERSKETIAELPSENKHDLAVEEVPAPIEDTETTVDGATDAEPAVLGSTASSSEDVTVSRESNFEDLREAHPISDDKTSGKVATAIEEEDSSVDAVASDTASLETSTPPPAVENTESQRSLDLHEVAVNLEDAAEKTLEDVKSSAVGDGKASYSESVAHIVLDERSKTDDSSELISGVIQHVAQLAQDDFQSDPNVLPDTVNQVFDRGAAGSRANDAGQPKENTSLGTKFSLFVIWCISLCASHVSSKSMPAPALKLGAEEVAAVLHSNAQGAASSQAASSV